MTAQVFSRHIETYSLWKAQVAKEIRAYRLWLRRNNLFTPEGDMRLYQLLETLRSDYVTIAFAGEFSRGKTELINAIFFSGFGQRILPSQAGRTTMCPTELFYDRETRTSYLRLLPIETRLTDIPIADYRGMPGQWVEIPLMADNPSEMARVMMSLTETKVVPVADAVKLGFKEELLDESENEPGKVEIPAWRHALVSFPHPLLQQGLCILDTPGLNALGSEPELTLSLLPQAQAVVFVMAADQGVTASDMAIWNEHVASLKDRPNLGLYAVLNKVDTLWDELDSRKKIEKALSRVVRATSRQLELKESDIVPVSAKQGLLAKVRDDQALLLRSHILELEKLLSDAVLGYRRQALWESVIEECAAHVENSLQLLNTRREQLLSQKHDLENLQESNVEALTGMVQKAQKLHEEFKRKQTALTPTQRLMDRQSNILQGIISNEVISQLIERTQGRLMNARTTVGLVRAMREFFTEIDAIIGELSHQADLSNRMAESVYRKFENEFGLQRIEPRLLPARGFRRRLHEFIHDADELSRLMQIALNFESLAVRRFFTTTVAQITEFLQAVRRELHSWGQNALAPLSQQLASQKLTVEQHLQQLQNMQRTGATAAGRIKALNTLVMDLDGEAAQAAQMLETLRSPPPEDEDSNVVAFSRAWQR
ncbi:dynamin family protein [Permianibacter aggregans]|uniref:Dynamin family protein n=1 Tax=Permianibacter aggregans TaxID=1510150 RepID=A0A4R6UF80_9GAMM|nr:dynamin family protein [Permianibacter aggregans]QGX39625.1 GTPase [Permianibacter aggregans]TDQ45470.1 dynamin family protein [Permianibacter aggregans]